jgi:hypothetical protein
VTVFRTIILNLEGELGKLRVLKEIAKYRVFNFSKFIEETAVYA